MAEVEFWLGSVGPFLYDDTDDYGDGTADSMSTLRTSGQIKVTGTPAESGHVVRLEDLDLATSSADSTIYSAISSQSQVVSGLDSQAASANLSQSSIISTTSSVNDSQTSQLSVVESRLTSHGI